MRAVPVRLGLASILLQCAGCGTLMTPAQVEPTLHVRDPELRASVSEVHTSAELRGRDFSSDSRVLVVLDVRAVEPLRLDLREAKLSLTAVASARETRPAIASGVGEAPRLLQDGEHAALSLAAGESARAWVAFGEFAERPQREIPERIALELPGRQRIVLSDPGALPTWTGEPVTASTSAGLSFQASADEGAINLLTTDSRFVVDPLVLSLYTGFGQRIPQWASREGQRSVCCNFLLGIGASWPLVQTRDVSFGPYLGGEAAVLLSGDDVRRRHWFGPAAGVELSLAPLVPRHGPFPIDYPRARLGAVNLRAALVHWFGPDRELPSFGATFGFGLAIGR